MKYKVGFHDVPSLLFEADGYYVQRDGCLTLYQKSNTMDNFEEIVSLEQLMAPVVTQSVASFPRGEWKNVYLNEGVESEQ